MAKYSKTTGALILSTAGLVAARSGYKKAKRKLRRKKALSQPFRYLDSVSERSGCDVEGLRMLAGAVPAVEINETLQISDAINPIRVYAGLAHGQDAAARVMWAMEELERLGAFEREVIYLWTPTGRGYCHPVPMECLEFMFHGNTAIVAVQYADDRSLAAVRRLEEGIQAQKLLLEAITARIENMETKPRIYMYGESLGAWGSTEALFHSHGRPTLSGALWVGLPWDGFFRYNKLKQIININEGTEKGEISPFYMLMNEDDPVSNFDGSKIFYRPRPYLKQMGRKWMPGISFTKMLISIEQATRPIPGVMGTTGHDYRGHVPYVFAAQHDIDAKKVAVIFNELTYREQTRGQRYKFLYGLPIKMD